jgi:hypothetical protein
MGAGCFQPTLYWEQRLCGNSQVGIPDSTEETVVRTQFFPSGGKKFATCKIFSS